jgi:hypothetical protein
LPKFHQTTICNLTSEDFLLHVGFEDFWGMSSQIRDLVAINRACSICTGFLPSHPKKCHQTLFYFIDFTLKKGVNSLLGSIQSYNYTTPREPLSSKISLKIVQG